MATFLTTSRMNPALRARVERSVSYRTRAKHNAGKLGMKGTFASAQRLRAARLVPFVTLLFVVGLGGAAYVHASRIIQDDRSTLLTTIAEHRAELPQGYQDFFARVDTFLDEISTKTPASDWVDPELKEPGALDAWLGKKAVYVHAPMADLADSHRRDDAAAASDKDAFLYCLMNPPLAQSEKELLNSIRGVYFAGGKVDDETSNVRRLNRTRVGLSVLLPEFEARVQAAEEALALKKLRKDFEAAPTADAAKAAASEVLIAVADEPGSKHVRVSIVDLAGMKALVRLRLPIPAVSGSMLATLHRTDLEGCTAALAVRNQTGETP
ncbi:MAG: hypothetical protein IPK82_35120 [Polyangiaceae bacterium]|nr:hypothetical protein [Polyangiaceae bacterium]